MAMAVIATGVAAIVATIVAAVIIIAAISFL